MFRYLKKILRDLFSSKSDENQIPTEPIQEDSYGNKSIADEVSEDRREQKQNRDLDFSKEYSPDFITEFDYDEKISPEDSIKDDFNEERSPIEETKSRNEVREIDLFEYTKMLTEEDMDDPFGEPREIEKKAPLDLIIGFDLGTSSSKVVVQAPDLPDSPAWPVDFDALGHNKSKFILPTQLYYNQKNRTVSLKKQNTSDVLYIHIKTGLCSSTFKTSKIEIQSIFEKESKEALAAAYISFALTYVKEHIFKEKNDILSAYSINWSINLGVPSPTLDHFKEKESFERVIKIAWVLSESGTDSFVMSLEDIKNEIKLLNQDPDEYIRTNKIPETNLIPEIIAGSYGYTLSPQRIDSLHVMVDIGAFTVDVCGFSLFRHYETKENTNALLYANVEDAGSFRFYRLMGSKDYLSPIKPNLDAESIVDIKDDFKKAVRKNIFDLKTKSAPREKVWREEEMLPIIIIGGGSRISYYDDWLTDLNSWLQNRYIKNRGFRFIEPSLPDGWTEEQGVYLSIAWGLSHRALDIGRFTASSKTKDFPPPETAKTPERISKDQV